jgi:hypothetical protein
MPASTARTAPARKAPATAIATGSRGRRIELTPKDARLLRLLIARWRQARLAVVGRFGSDVSPAFKAAVRRNRQLERDFPDIDERRKQEGYDGLDEFLRSCAGWMSGSIGHMDDVCWRTLFHAERDIVHAVIVLDRGTMTLRPCVLSFEGWRFRAEYHNTESSEDYVKLTAKRIPGHAAGKAAQPARAAHAPRGTALVRGFDVGGKPLKPPGE